MSTRWTIYSATSFLEKCRKVVQEIWFEKSGWRKMVGEKWLTRKKSEFAEPLFWHHFSTLFWKSGCRINGPLVDWKSKCLKFSLHVSTHKSITWEKINLKFRLIFTSWHDKAPPHVLWQVSFGFWVMWSISSWQEHYKSFFFPKCSDQ